MTQLGYSEHLYAARLEAEASVDKVFPFYIQVVDTLMTSTAIVIYTWRYSDSLLPPSCAVEVHCILRETHHKDRSFIDLAVMDCATRLLIQEKNRTSKCWVETEYGVGLPAAPNLVVPVAVDLKSISSRTVLVGGATWPLSKEKFLLDGV